MIVNSVKQKLCFVLILVMLIVSCASRRQDVSTQQPMRTDISLGITQRKNITDYRTNQLAMMLREEGISIISVGQDYRLIVPASNLFFARSPRLRNDGYGTLNLVGNYLKQFRTVGVRVSGFTAEKNAARAGALSFARARAVSNYLWSQEVDARMLYTQSHSIVGNRACDVGDGFKRRGDYRSHIEIAFRNRIV